MPKAIFQILAAFTLLAAAVVGVGSLFVVTRYPPTSILSLAPLVAVEIALVTAAIGLLGLRKWAAIIVSILALGAAKWQIESAIHPIPGNANWLGFLFAILLATPAVLTAAYWRTLTWTGK